MLNSNSQSQSHIFSNHNRQINLTHYLVEILPSNILDIINPESQFYEICQEAKALSFTEIQKELSQLIKGHNSLKIEITYLTKRLESSGFVIPNDDFLEVMKPFEALVNLSLADLNDINKEALANFDITKKFFVEESKTSADIFFSQIHDFLKDLSKAKEENEIHLERLRAEQKKSRMLSISKTSHRLASNETGSMERIDELPVDSNGQMTNSYSLSTNIVSTPRSRQVYAPNAIKVGQPMRNGQNSRNNNNSVTRSANNRQTSGASNKSEDFDDLLSVIKSGDLFSSSGGPVQRRGPRQSSITHGYNNY